MFSKSNKPTTSEEQPGFSDKGIFGIVGLSNQEVYMLIYDQIVWYSLYYCVLV